MKKESSRDPLDTRRPFWSLLGVSAVPLACGLFLGEAPGVAASVQLGDLREAHIVEVRDARGHAVLTGELRSHTNRTGAEEKDAALIAPDGHSVVGEIEIEVPRPDALNPHQELEVDIIHLAPRATFMVVIDDRPVLSFRTDDRGSVDIEVEEPLRTR